MCQLNTYFVPKSLGITKALQLMAAAGLNCCAQMDDYDSMVEFREYHAFFAAPQRCNCNSIVARLQDSPYTNFQEYCVKCMACEVARLEGCRDFMLADGYPQRRAEFEVQMEDYQSRMCAQSAWIAQKEQDMTSRIMQDPKLSDEEKSRRMHEEVYPVIAQLLEENELRPEVTALRTAYQAFLEANEQMWQSYVYTLESVAPHTVPLVPLTFQKAAELGGYGSIDDDEPDSQDADDDTSEEELLTFTLPSNNIFDAIEQAKNRDFSEELDEFCAIQRFVTSVLAHCDHMMLFAYWQTDDCVINSTRTVRLEEFDIDSVAQLPYLTLLKIQK